MRNEFDHRPEPPNGGIFSGDGWKWVLGIAAFVGLIVVCNVAANDAAREDTQSAREAQRWSEGLKTATTSDRASATVRPTVETTYADLTVWRFCSGIIAGTLTQTQLDAVYRLNEAELSKDREQKLAVVRLLKRQVDQGLQRGTSPTATDVREMQAACQEVRRADRER